MQGLGSPQLVWGVRDPCIDKRSTEGARYVPSVCSGLDRCLITIQSKRVYAVIIRRCGKVGGNANGGHRNAPAHLFREWDGDGLFIRPVQIHDDDGRFNADRMVDRRIRGEPGF